MTAAGIDPAFVLDSLPSHLGEHLARQRWSGAHDRGIAEVSLRWNEVVAEGDPLLLWMLAGVRFDDGDEQDYQLFVGARSLDDAPKFMQGKERETIAVLAGPDGGIVVYDGLVDPELAAAVLHLTAPDVQAEVHRPIVLEHSNSSVVFDENLILKVFRKIEPGPNPDVEIPRVLADHGYPHVLPSLGELRRDGMDLVVLRPFLVGATEGWDLARGSVRDVLASGLVPEEAGGDLGPDIERLGEALAGLHLTMAEAWGAEPGDPGLWVEEMRANLEATLAVGASAGGPARLPADEIEAYLDRFAGLADAGAHQRIHGDLHLAQVLKTDDGWTILDFEGEPARRRAQRFTASSPLRDVAGILRSLHYVAAVGLADWDPADDRLRALAAAWEQRNRRALLEGYLATEGIAALLPGDPGARDTVLAGFELDKAVYEVRYELGHRPDHVDIPLDGVRRLLRTGVVS